MNAFVGDFVPLVPNVNLRHVAFLAKFVALLVGKLEKAPEQHARAGGAAVIEAVSAALHLLVVDVEISLPAERLDRLIQQILRLPRIRLLHGHDWTLRARWGCARLVHWRRRLRSRRSGS